MMKLIKYLIGLFVGMAALGVSAFLLLTYWERLLSYATAGARVAANILKTFAGDTLDKDDPADYFAGEGDFDI